MPRIQGYEQQYAASGGIPARQAQESDFGGPGLIQVGRAVQAVGQDAGYAYNQAQAQIDAQKQQASNLALHQRVTEAQSEWALAEQERQKQARPDAAGHLEETVSTIKTNIDQEVERVLLDEQGTILHSDIPRLRLELSKTGNHIISSASLFAASTGAKHQIAQLGNTVGSMQNAVRSDPSLLGINLERIDDLVDGLTMANRGDIPGIKDASRRSVVDAALDGRVDQIARNLTPASVAALRKQVEDKSNIWVKEASPAGYARALDRLNVLEQHTKNLSTVIAADALSERIREASAGIENKLDVKEAAYEQDPAKRALLERRILEARAVGEATRVMRGASFADQVNLIAASHNLLEKSGNYDLDKARLDAMKTVFANQYQAIKQDPAGVAAQNEAVKISYEAIRSDDPSSVEQYVTATKAEQKRIAPYQEPVLLTKDHVGQIKAVMDGIDRGPQGASQAEKILGEQYRLWGKYWPEVSRQLMQEKVLTDAQAAAARMIMDPLKHADMRVLLATSTMNPKEIDDLLPVGTVIRVEQAVNQKLIPFYDAMAAQSNGQQEMARHFKAVKSLALGYRLRDKNLSEVKAAEMAADNVLMKDFHWKGSYFIPKAYEPSTIERGIKTAMRDLPTLASSIQFPQSLAGLREEEKSAAVMDTLLNASQWATNADNTGVVLQWGNRDHTPVMIQHHGSQIPLSYTWEELQRMGVK